MKLLRWLKKYIWLWTLLLVAAAVLFFTCTGNETILPAIYR